MKHSTYETRSPKERCARRGRLGGGGKIKSMERECVFEVRPSFHRLDHLEQSRKLQSTRKLVHALFPSPRLFLNGLIRHGGRELQQP